MTFSETRAWFTSFQSTIKDRIWKTIVLSIYITVCKYCTRGLPWRRLYIWSDTLMDNRNIIKYHKAITNNDLSSPSISFITVECFGSCILKMVKDNYKMKRMQLKLVEKCTSQWNSVIKLLESFSRLNGVKKCLTSAVILLWNFHVIS